ncbi:MAG: TolC family protein [Muribaculaceae bacterium]|nr:TolC family protein [Muribaculaceae bacterium]
MKYLTNKGILQACLVSISMVGFVSEMIASEKKMFEEVVESDLIVGRDTLLPSAWSYDECLERAVATNTDIRQTLLSILQADEDVASAKDAWLPSVDFSTNHGYTNYPVPGKGAKGNIYNSNYGVNASWTVWEGNARKYRLESAKLVRQQQQLAGEEIVKDLQLGILQAYLNILYSEEAINIASKTLEVSTSQTERMRKLVESGRESKVDLAQIESQMAQDQYNLIRAESDLATNKMNLKKLLVLGLDYDLNVVHVDFPDSEVTAPLLPMGETYLTATRWLPGLKSNTLSAEIYANDVKIAQANSAPNIALQGGVGTGYTTGGRDWGYQMGHGLNENIGLSLSLPIYDGNKTKRAVAKARLASMEADISREQLLNDLSQTIESLYIDAQNAQAKYKSGIVQLEAMEETARLVDRQFELGLVNPLELLTAHNNLLNARLEQLQNKYMAILASKTIGFYATQKVSLP